MTAVFPELVNRDITKFAAAMGQVVQAVIQMIDAGLLTEETALKLVADVAQRFGQDFDAKTELEAARKEHQARQDTRAAADVFGNMPADMAAARAAAASGTGLEAGDASGGEAHG